MNTYFAQVLEGRVVEIIVADSAFIQSGAVGDPSQWIETAKDYSESTLRKNPARIGGSYDASADAFYNPQPFASWTLDLTTYQWQPPQPRPQSGYWRWDESTTAWVEIVIPV
jgi:hypothetical protein